MRKLIALTLALLMVCAACFALAESTGNKIQGSLEDGSYILTVQVRPEDRGTWKADEMAQDQTVVKLASSGTENGVFTARYDPTGDGDVTVTLRHFTEHAVCDALHTFDLRVQGGAVTETLGGSMTASPAADELNAYISGEWLEKDTQFTVLDATRRVDDGWDIEITSPMTHGAYVIRATAYFDCDWDAFIYADGVKTNLPEGGDTPAQTGLWGKIRFGGTEDNLQLVWSEGVSSDEIIFDRAPALPPYAYTGADEIEGAVANALAQDERAALYLTEPGCVTIPCPIIHRTEQPDDTHAKVYGSFWIMNYVKRGDCLKAISGGEHAGVMALEKVDGVWKSADLEEAEGGEDYAEDIRRFANGDKALEDQYFAGSDLLSEENQAIRTRYIREYVEANSLAISSYQDYGWDPVSLN